MFKYCPHCKSDKLIFNNQHYWTCADCDFVYFHNAAAAVAGIITFQGKILFTLRGKEPKQGLLDLPGGFIDHHESLEEGLSREVFEELNLQIAPTHWRYLTSFPNDYQYKTIDYHTMDCIFTYELTALPTLTLEASEIAGIQWLALNEIDWHKIAFDSQYKALKTFCDQHNSINN